MRIRSFVRSSYAEEETRTRTSDEVGWSEFYSEQRVKPRKLSSALLTIRKRNGGMRYRRSAKRRYAIPISSRFPVFLFATPLSENRLSIPRIINSCQQVMKLKAMGSPRFRAYNWQREEFSRQYSYFIV